MAQSDKSTMKRLDALEAAMVQVTHVLIDQSERMDAGFRAVREEIHDLQSGFAAVTDRLDRLIEITTKERTLGIERLSDLERRVSRLEQNAGL